MKIDRNAKPELAASKDASRPAIQNPWLDAEHSVIVATDSYILVKIPVEAEGGDVSGPIPIDAIKAARKHTPKSDRVDLAADGDVVVPGYATFDRNLALEFVNWQKTSTFEGEPLATFGLNGELLARAQKALGCAAVKVELFGALQPLRVTPLHGEGVAIVMPVRLSEAPS